MFGVSLHRGQSGPQPRGWRQQSDPGGCERAPFAIESNRERIVVDPAGAELGLSRSYRGYAARENEPPAPADAGRQGLADRLGLGETTYRYAEYRLEPGAEVFVAGYAEDDGTTLRLPRKSRDDDPLGRDKPEWPFLVTDEGSLRGLSRWTGPFGRWTALTLGYCLTIIVAWQYGPW